MSLTTAKLRKLVSLVLLLPILGHAPASLACGPFTLSAVFTFTVHPEYPLERFAQGQIGIVRPTYARSYLYAAYRHLAGLGLKPEEQDGLVSLWRDRLDLRTGSEETDTIQTWLTARGKVPGVGPEPKIDVYRSREKPNEYESYLNCPQDAFANAATTLNSRIAKFGADNELIKDWVGAQDQVFANCSEGTHLPAAAPATADSQIKSDRSYQLAAANFYAGNFPEARNLFVAISRDQDSPWRNSAPYLLARTFVREASLGAAEKRNEALTAAEEKLNAILKDSSLRDIHEPARRLLTIVAFRLHPEERLLALAGRLANKEPNGSLKQELWDYTMLLDQFLGDDDSEQQKELPAAIKQDELTDWIVTFQLTTLEALQHSLERWQQQQSIPWLISTISKIHAGHPQSRQVLDAAARIDPASPAFASAAFHTVRLQIESGRFDEARARLDEILSAERSRLNSSSLNQFEHQRMILASDLDDFLKHAQRVPAAFSWDDDGRELPADESELSDETKTLRGQQLFDSDAAKLLNQNFPLELWRKAALSDVLSPRLKRDLTQAAWIRAVILSDVRTADALAPALKTLAPEMTSLLNEYTATRQPEAKRFSAIFTWLKFPGLEPVVDSGVGREVALGEQDSYRDNWWCGAAFLRQPAGETTTGGKAEEMERLPLFLTDAQRSAGTAEWSKLAAIGAAPNLLSREVIQWATRNPTDRRVPEALHLAVKSTRYGCTDQQTARWSKAAFDLLHRRYPASAWAKRTPYWFKD